MSRLSDILDAIVDLETAAALTISGTDLTVSKRKLPKSEESVDADYQVTVSGAERPDRCQRIAFGGRWKINYRIEITLIIPASDAITNLDAVTNWREAVRARYMTPGVLSAAGVSSAQIEDGILFDRNLLNKNFDYDQIVLSCTTFENRGS